VTPSPTPNADDAAQVAAFRVALRRFMRQTELVARECGVTPQWHLLLLQIKGAPDLSERATVTDLADRLQLAQSSVTELVARVEHAGLIRRERSDDDGRVVYLRLTPDGEQRFAKVFRNLAAERQALRDAIAGLDG
jgi:DNA-binding MarR family transcriptional regulator